MKGTGDVLFGQTPDEVRAAIGNPDYYEEVDNEDEAPILYYEYESQQTNLYFEEIDGMITLSYAETENPDATIFGERLFGLKPDALVNMMKTKGFALSEKETDEGETRFSFDDAMIDFFFEGEKMTAVSWSCE